MPKIQVDPEQMRELARQMAEAGWRIAGIRSAMASAWGRLQTAGWEGHHRANVEGLWNRAQGQAATLAEQAAALSRFLDEHISAFEEAEHVNIAVLAQVMAGLESLPAAAREWMSGLLRRVVSFPRAAMERLLRLGDIVGEHVDRWVLFGGLGLISVLRGIGVGSVPTPQGAERMEEVHPPEPSVQPPGSGFGELLRRAEQERETELPVPSAEVHYSVPALKQTARSYECAPSAVSMIMQYYNEERGSQALTPREIIQGLDGHFDPKKGIAADKLVEGLQGMDLEYRTIEWEAGLNRESLLSELRQGPVIAQVHLGLGTSGNAHMVVVTGASGGGDTIYINDPWTGQSRELTWEVFERTWTFSQYPKGSHLIIRMRP